MLNFKPKLIAILLAANFAAASAIAADSKEEVLLGVKITAENIELTVASGGCTKKEDFSIEVNKRTEEQSPYVLTVRRNTRDECKAWLPEGVTVKFSKEELNLNEAREITITNKIKNSPSIIKP